MDVLVVNNRQVIKCVHCNGSGTCKHSGYLQTTKETKDSCGEIKIIRGAVLACPKCGEGVFRPGKCNLFTYESPSSAYMTSPVCGVCGGTGYNIVG